MLGTIDDVFGTTQDIGFVIELGRDVQIDSVDVGTKIFGESRNMLPIDRFMPKPKSDKPDKPKR